MRGRTNASNGGIFLNATTDDFEVATGNTIVAGDFVEYHYDSEIKDLSIVSSNDDIRIYDRINDNLFVGINLDLLTIFELNQGTLSIKNTSQYEALVVNNATPIYLGNNKIASCSYDSSLANYYVSVYSIDITTGTLTLLNKIQIAHNPSSSYGTSPTCLGIFDDNQIVYGYYTFLRSASTTSYYMGIIDYSDLSDIHIVQAVGINPDMTYSGGFGFIGSGNGKIAFGVAGKYQSSSTTKYQKCIATLADSTISVSREETTESTYNSYFRYTSTLNAPTKNLTYLGENNRFFFNGVGLFDSTDDSFYAIKYVNIGLLSYIEQAVGLPNNRVIVKCNGYYYYLLEFDALSKGFTLLSSEPYQLQLSGNIYYDMILKTNGNKALLSFCHYVTSPSRVYTERYAFLSVNNSNNIEIGEPTNTVEEWAGSGNPLGVAKQSGTAGDTIQVYVPTVNS